MTLLKGVIIRIYRFATLAVIVCACSLTASRLLAGTYGGGAGEPDDPYRLSSPGHWQEFMGTSADWSRSFVLIDDVNLAGVVLTPVGNATTPFAGTFDGNGHVIRSATINTPDGDYVGLFGYTETGSQVRSLGAESVYMNGRYNVGGLVGQNGGTLSDCHATGSVSGASSVGGLAGYSAGTLNGCHAAVAVDGFDSAGGLVGWSTSPLSGCYATGTVMGYQLIGGLVGLNAAQLDKCHATGPVTGTNDVGGLVGLNAMFSATSTCYATGSVSGSCDVGGLAGYYEGSLANCYATGTAAGTDYVGGLVGSANYITISSCYAAGYVSGTSRVGGLIGTIGLDGYTDNSFWDTVTSGQPGGVGEGSPAGVYGRTTDEMKRQATFADYNWDFLGETVNGTNDIWRMCGDGAAYPKLSWESAAGDFTCPDGVGVEDLSYFAEQWLSSGCVISNNCSGTDMDVSGSVDFADFALMAANW